MLLILFYYVPFLAAGACLSWSLPSIYHRAASLLSQASSVDVCSIGWRTIDQALLKHQVNNGWQTLSLHVSVNTNHVSNSTILSNNYVLLLSDLCACVEVKKMALIMKPYSSSVIGSNCLVRLQRCLKVMGWCTAQCKMLLFCVKNTLCKSNTTLN